jgi:hypothetical protein
MVPAGHKNRVELKEPGGQKYPPGQASVQPSAPTLSLLLQVPPGQGNFPPPVQYLPGPQGAVVGVGRGEGVAGGVALPECAGEAVMVGECEALGQGEGSLGVGVAKVLVEAREEGLVDGGGLALALPEGVAAEEGEAAALALRVAASVEEAQSEGGSEAMGLGLFVCDAVEDGEAQGVGGDEERGEVESDTAELWLSEGGAVGAGEGEG